MEFYFLEGKFCQKCSLFYLNDANILSSSDILLM